VNGQLFFHLSIKDAGKRKVYPSFRKFGLVFIAEPMHSRDFKGVRAALRARPNPRLFSLSSEKGWQREYFLI
jgi:hypothetical protein